MPLEVLLINVHSMLNTGDAALTLETIRQLKDNFPGCHITLLMDDPDTRSVDAKVLESIFAWVRSPYKTGRAAWNFWHLILLPAATLLPILTYRLFGKPFYLLTPGRLRAAIQSHLNANLVVSKPGGYLYTSRSGLRLVVIIYTLALVWLSGKPLYMFPQSFGPLARRWEGRLLRWILDKARVVMAREPVSMELLQKFHIHRPRLCLLPDTAFAFVAASPQVAGEWLRENGLDQASERPLLGLTVLNWSAGDLNFNRQDNYEAACAAAIRHFVGQLGGRAILFPQVTGPNADSDDRIPARRIVARLRDIASSILQIEQQIPPDLIKALYGKLDILIGTRMHSNIFALSEGVPVIAIGYLHKTRGIASMLDLDRWVLDIQSITRESLVDKLVELWEERRAVSAQIAGILPSLVEQSKRAGLFCAEDYALLKENKLYG
jgi:colanic acid/amylovoran biosynthesis protein WcaK/AmsJ